MDWLGLKYLYHLFCLESIFTLKYIYKIARSQDIPLKTSNERHFKTVRAGLVKYK